LEREGHRSRTLDSANIVEMIAKGHFNGKRSGEGGRKKKAKNVGRTRKGEESRRNRLQLKVENNKDQTQRQDAAERSAGKEAKNTP